jgi:hypothetical protein
MIFSFERRETVDSSAVVEAPFTYTWKLAAFLCIYHSRGAQIFQKSRSHLNIPGSKMVKWCNFHSDDPQILPTTVQNLVVTAPWCLGLGTSKSLSFLIKQTFKKETYRLIFKNLNQRDVRLFTFKEQQLFKSLFNQVDFGYFGLRDL